MPGNCLHHGLSFSKWRLRVYRDLFASLVPRDSSPLSFLQPLIATAQFTTTQPSRQKNVKADLGKRPKVRRNRGGHNRHRPRSKITKYQPFTETGRERLTQLVTGLQHIAAKAKKQYDSSKVKEKYDSVKKLGESEKYGSFKRLSVTQNDDHSSTPLDALDLPQSPIHRRLETQRLKHVIKPQPSPAQLALGRDPWVKMLASPVRQCQASGIRLPVRLLTNWRFMQHPENDDIYFMPGELAGLDKLELETGTVEWREQRKEERRAYYNQQKAQQAEEQSTSTEQQSAPAPSPDEGGSKETLSNNLQPVESSFLFPGTQPAIRVTPYANLLTMMTNEFTRPSPLDEPGDLSHRMDIPGAPQKLIPRRWRERIYTAKHYEQHRMEVQAATGQIDFRPPPIEAEIDLKKMRWQVDMESRLLTVLRRRVVLALQRMADSNSSNRLSKARRVSAIAIPGTRGESDQLVLPEEPEPDEEEEMHTAEKPEGSLELMSNTIIDPFSTETSTTTTETRRAPQPRRSIYAPLDVRLFIYVGIGPIQSSAPFITKQSMYIPPLLRNKPTHQTFPVFPLHDMLGDEHYSEVLNIIRDHDILQLRHSVAVEGKRQEMDNEENGYLIMVKVKKAYTEVLLAEMWRLWRYIGGQRSMA